MRAGLVWGCILLGLASAAIAKPPHGEKAAARPVALLAARTAARYGVITSTVRSVEHNRAVGGVPDSYHLFGRAIDVVRKPGVTHAQLAAALRAAGYHLIESLDEGDHSHFAFALPAGATPPPKPPEQVLRTLLAADHHGTLLLDLAKSEHADVIARRSGGSGVRSAR